MHQYYEYRRPDVIDMVRRALRPGGRALDVGCASGRLGEQLLSLGFEEVWGVEIDPEAAAAAELRLTRVVRSPFPCADVESGAPFDLIVMADSLEHLSDPWAGLAAARDLLAPGGRLCLSLPNVSHFSVLMMQLRGRWDYADSGLLDRGHLRFFTPASAETWLRDAGFVIDATEELVITPRRRWAPVTWLVRQFLPHVFVCQFRVMARKAGDS